jgi:hypothetical protein
MLRFIGHGVKMLMDEPASQSVVFRGGHTQLVKAVEAAITKLTASA